MSERSPFSELSRLPMSGAIFIAGLLILGALLLISTGPTQDASIRPTAAVTAQATAVATSSGS